MKAKRLGKGFGHWTMIVRENVSAYEREVLAGGAMQSSRDIHKLLCERALSEDVERMYVIGLDGRNRVRFLHEVARGGLHGCAVACRDILRVALMGHASAFALVHNHPSGDPTPSPEDIAMTHVVRKAADVVGCPLVDHVVIASTERYASMLDLGLLAS